MARTIAKLICGIGVWLAPLLGALGAEGAIPAQAVVDANRAFALKIYRELAKPDENLIFSPYSISTALAMTAIGAAGETRSQIVRALNVNVPPHPLAEQYATLQAHLNGIRTEGGDELLIANSLWPQQAWPFLPDFLGTLNAKFHASIAPVDYRNDPEGARKVINNWIDDKTRHKIAEAIPNGAVTEATRMVLVNAVYFKGRWAHEFARKDTQPQKFVTASRASVETPMMHQDGIFNYFGDDDIQVLALPYAGAALEMLIVLPRSADGLAKVEATLTPIKLQQWIADLRRVEAKVWFPRFSLKWQRTLNATLSRLGMVDAFDEQRADFSNMDGRRDLSISSVNHGAVIEVNEEGTVAAAATTIVTGITSLHSPPKPVIFRADHPFLFFILERQTGSVLFMGRLVNPDASLGGI